MLIKKNRPIIHFIISYFPFLRTTLKTNFDYHLNISIFILYHIICILLGGYHRFINVQILDNVIELYNIPFREE